MADQSVGTFTLEVRGEFANSPQLDAPPLPLYANCDNIRPQLIPVSSI